MSLLNWALRSQIYTKNIWIELGKKQRDNTLSWQACFVIRSFFGSYFYILSTVIRKNGNIDFFIKIKNKKICIYIYIYIYISIYIINSRSFWLIRKFSLSVPYEIYGEPYGEYAHCYCVKDLKTKKYQGFYCHPQICKSFLT